MIRKSPSVVPVQVEQKQGRAKRASRKNVPLHAPLRGRYSPAGAQLDLYHEEFDAESHSVRERLGRLDVAYVSHGLPTRKALAQKRLKDAGGSGRIPFLRDRRTGMKLEGRDAILNYIEKEFGEGDRSKSVPNGSEIIRRVTESIEQRREDFRWRLMAPVDDAKLLALDWKRAFRTTLDSARELAGVVRDLVKDVSGDLAQEKKSGLPIRIAGQ